MATRSSQITICIHATAHAMDVIERGAQALNISAATFIVDASIRRAVAVLGDRTRFALSDGEMETFVSALEEPLPNPAALKALLEHRAPWE